MSRLMLAMTATCCHNNAVWGRGSASVEPLCSTPLHSLTMDGDGDDGVFFYGAGGTFSARGGGMGGTPAAPAPAPAPATGVLLSPEQMAAAVAQLHLAMMGGGAGSGPVLPFAMPAVPDAPSAHHPPHTAPHTAPGAGRGGSWASIASRPGAPAVVAAHAKMAAKTVVRGVPVPSAGPSATASGTAAGVVTAAGGEGAEAADAAADNEAVPLCVFFLQGTCRRGESCRYRHVRPREDTAEAAIGFFVAHLQAARAAADQAAMAAAATAAAAAAAVMPGSGALVAPAVASLASAPSAPLYVGRDGDGSGEARLATDAGVGLGAPISTALDGDGEAGDAEFEAAAARWFEEMTAEDSDSGSEAVAPSPPPLPPSSASGVSVAGSGAGAISSGSGAGAGGRVAGGGPGASGGAAGGETSGAASSLASTVDAVPAPVPVPAAEVEEGTVDRRVLAQAVARGLVATLAEAEAAYQMAERRIAADITCGICFDAVTTTPGRRFGLLTGCAHAFCLDCIRQWRGRIDLPKETVRNCPLCRRVSYFIIPCDRFVTDPARKARINREYHAQQRAIPCRHFDYGRGQCPFGTSCFYAHLNPDGTPYIAPKHVIRLDGDGAVSVSRAYKLSEFL